jgi:hypothetical protein
MFGWNRVGEPYRSTDNRYGFTLEEHKNGLWLNVYWRHWRACFCRYNGLGRFTVPAENRSVLAYFLQGPDKRPRGKAFSSGFAEAARKPPIKSPLPRYGERYDYDPEC